MAADIETRLARLVDRVEIAEIMGAYCLGMDMRDWDLYRSCWTDRIYFDVPDFSNGSAGEIDIDIWIRALQAFFEEMPQSQHVKIPIRFEFDGDTAVVHASMQGKHWMPSKNGGPLQTVVGYYRDEFVRTEAGWKMRGSKEIIYWNEGNSHVIDIGLGKMGRILRGEA